MDANNITPQDIKNFYDEMFVTSSLRESDKYYAWILRLLKPQRGKKLLDVACGEGALLRQAERLDIDTHGIDISSEGINKARKNAPNSKIEVGDGESLPWHNDCFDYITSLGSLEHYLHPDKGAREIARVLKKDGTACIMLPNSFPLDEVIKVLFTGKSGLTWQVLDRVASKIQWKELLQKNGLKVTKIYGYNKFPELFAPDTFRLKSIRKFLIRAFSKCFTPLNLSYSFVYLCTKEKKAGNRS